MENSIERYWTPNRNFYKAQTIYRFCQTENSKCCDKLEESSTKPAGIDCPSSDQRGCWKLYDPWFKPGRETIIFLSEKLISFRVQYLTWVYYKSNETSALFLWVLLFSHKRLIEVNMEGLIFIWNLLAAYSLLFHHFNEQKNYQKYSMLFSHHYFPFWAYSINHPEIILISSCW